MNRICYEILAGTRFPGYENGRRRRRHPLDRIIDFRHRFTGTDYPLPVYIIRADKEFFLIKPSGPDGLMDYIFQFILFKRFGDIIEGALLQSVHCRGNSTVSGDDNNRGRRIFMNHPLEETHAVELRHSQISHDDLHAAALENLQGLDTVRCRGHVIAFLIQQGL